MRLGSEATLLCADRTDSRTRWHLESGAARIVKLSARFAPLGLCLALLCTALPATGQEGDKELEATNVPGEFARGRVPVAERKLLNWLAEGGNPNWAIDPNENAFIHYAAGISTYGGNILAQTIAVGGDCSLRNAHGEMPLHWAAAGRGFAPGPATAGLLLKCGADPNARDNYGNTPLLALYLGVYDPGVPLPVNDITGKRSERESFLKGGARVDTLRVLLGAGADANTRNDIGDRPLMIAVGSKDVALSISRGSHLELLLGAGADPNARGAGRDNFGSLTSLFVTPLIQVLLSEYYEDERLAIMTLLLESGADPNRRDEAGDTTLAHAISLLEHPPATIKVLLGGGADPDLRDGSGETPLMQAVLELDDPSATVKALLDGGANPCLRGRDGKLPSFVPDPESETWRLLVNAGGFLDLNTGVCMHDAWKADEKEKALGLSRDARRGIQSCLKTQGFDPGPADGLFGPRTRAAIGSWQAAQGQDGSEAAGHISSQDQLDELLAGCRVALKPLCTGETGMPCWQETANQPGCHIWNSEPAAEKTVTWSGRCVDGKASGKGEIVWRFRKDGQWKTTGGEGEIREGRFYHGHWVMRFHDGAVSEGPYVEDRRHGHWIWRLPDGTIEGPYVDGEFHGLWVAQGSEERLCWQNGEDRDEAACGLRAVDRTMQAAERAVLRRGPGSDYSQAHGRLEAGAKVTVTHEAGEWLRLEDERGNTGFVLASVLEEVDTGTSCYFTDDVCAYSETYSYLSKLARQHSLSNIANEIAQSSGWDSADYIAANRAAAAAWDEASDAHMIWNDSIVACIGYDMNTTFSSTGEWQNANYAANAVGVRGALAVASTATAPDIIALARKVAHDWSSALDPNSDLNDCIEDEYN